MKFIITDDGRLVPNSSGFDYEYHIKDHLGNVRVTVKDSLGFASVQQEDHFYPYGGILSGQSYQNPLQSAVNKYLYNGKELQEDNGLWLYDYNARYYDPYGRLGFTTIDPLSEEAYSFSPYNYCTGNPINLIDPTGMKAVWNGKYGNESGYYDDETGKSRTWDQVQNEYGIGESEPTKNIAISLHSPLELTNYMLNNGIQGTWKTIFSSNLIDAKNELLKHLDGWKAHNIFLFGHGYGEGDPGSIPIKVFNSHQIAADGYSINSFLTDPDKFKANYLDWYLNISALKQIGNAIIQYGHFISNACGSGAGDKGAMLGSKLFELFEKRVNIALYTGLGERKFDVGGKGKAAYLHFNAIISGSEKKWLYFPTSGKPYYKRSLRINTSNNAGKAVDFN